MGGSRNAAQIGIVTMLDIETFDNLRGGNVAYKALAHPVAAASLAALASRAGRVAIFDPDGIAGPSGSRPGARRACGAGTHLLACSQGG